MNRRKLLHSNQQIKREVRVTLELGPTLADQIADEQAPSAVWVQVAAEGDYPGYPGGGFRFDRSVFENIQTNFRNHPSYVAGADGFGSADVIAWDFHHASEAFAAEGTIPLTGAPAQGWIQDLDVRDGAMGVELWALTRWLEPAKTYIREKRYKWASVTVAFNVRDPKTNTRIGAVLTSVALTNQPFIEGMAELVASKTASGGRKVRAMYWCEAARTPEQALEQMRGLLGLPQTSTVGDVLSQLMKLQEWSTSGAAPLGVDLNDMIGGIRQILNLPALSSNEEVFAETGKLLQRLLETQQPVEPSTIQTPPTAEPEAAAMTKEYDMTILKVLASMLSVQETEKAVQGAVEGYVALRSSLSKTLGCAENAADSVLLEAATASAGVKGKLEALLTALGVSDPGAAVAKVADLMANAAKLEEVMPELKELREKAEKTEEEEAAAEVDAVMNSKGYKDEGVRVALLQYRKSDKEGFRKQYPLPESAGSYLTSTIAASAKGAERKVIANQDGSVSLSALGRSPKGGAPSGGERKTVDLSKCAGRNRTERAMDYLKNNDANAAKLGLDDLFTAACELIKNSNIVDATG